MIATLFSIALNLTSCNPSADIVQPTDTSEVYTISGTRITAGIDSNSTLKSVAPFPIGAAFNSAIIARSTKNYNLFINQFNSKTVHAYMRIEHVRGQFDFTEQDYWVKFVKTNPMRLHGHCLLYHVSAPDWLLNFSGSTSDFEQAVQNHIQTIVGRYKGKMKGWDVANEIFDNSGSIRQTAFRQLYPSDAAYMAFIKRCFIWAHDADPDALLFYSDFGIESYPAKVQSILNMVKEFKRENIPIHGFGSHTHISINTSNIGIINSLKQLSTTGLQIHVSELDIKINPDNNQPMVFSDKLLTAQQAKYEYVAAAYKQAVPKQQQYGITLWDFSDADSWIVKQNGKLDAPCILDKTYNKKPAFYGLIAGLIK
ncbi:hypothetical protein GCM10027185_24390 [Spirosoma pulveris]